MDLITVIIIGAIVAVTGVINPKTKSPDEVAKAPETQVSTPVVEETEDATEEKGISALNIILYILGAIAAIAAAAYFFMRREPEAKSAADIARAQSQAEPTPEPQEESVQEETYSEPEPQPEPEQPVQEETPSETTQEETQSDNTDQSSNNDDENNNR